MCKKFMNVLIDHPFLTSIFVSDLLVLLLHKPPFLFSLLMIAVLIAISVFYGQKMATSEQ